MKLILASAGLTTPEIIAKCVELADKPQDKINFAVINEAYAVEHGDHGWVLDDLNVIKRHFAGRLELVNLLALDRETVARRIALADVIFTLGGHTDWLMHVFNRTGFAMLLPRLLESKVYIGSSAGAMVLGRRVSTAANKRIYGEAADYGVTEYLRVVDFALKPHMGSRLFPQNRPDVLAEMCKTFAGTVYGLADDAAIVVDGGQMYTLGSKPLKINDGILQA